MKPLPKPHGEKGHRAAAFYSSLFACRGKISSQLEALPVPAGRHLLQSLQPQMVSKLCKQFLLHTTNTWTPVGQPRLQQQGFNPLQQEDFMVLGFLFIPDAHTPHVLCFSISVLG